MCIALITTAHPDYALVVIDNRDEYILRPTSRPHWWTHAASGRQILSSRDMQRAEKGTWFGITKTGDLAVLTNFREAQSQDGDQSIRGVRSRGGMVTAWLGGISDDGVTEGVQHLIKDGGVKGVGGFSMICGKLRKSRQGIAIVSNRVDAMDDVPIVGQDRGKVWGLSNSVYDDQNEWPKVQAGKKALHNAVIQAASSQSSQEELVAELFSVLDADSLPEKQPDETFAEYIAQLKHSVFIPAVGDEVQRKAMEEAMAKGRSIEGADGLQLAAEELLAEKASGEKGNSATAAAFQTGLYGTQRQTVMLVDWDGNVTFIERALWDSNGHKIPRGDGDVTVTFKIEGWEN